MKTQNSPTDPIGPVGPTKTSAKKHTGCFSSVQTSYLFSGFCKLGLKVELKIGGGQVPLEI